MRIVFVDNLLFEQRNGVYHVELHPHLGLISLVAVARSLGHQAFLVDPKLEVAERRLSLDESLYERLACLIENLRPDAVGFTSLGCNFICTVKIAEHLKRRRKDLPILLGGPHATILQDRILEQFPQFDIVVRNEAEEKIGPLLSALDGHGLEKVQGIGFRVGGRFVSTQGDPVIADLDSLPEPAYDCYPIAALGLQTLRIEAGRGCPFKCRFCSTASFFGRRYRLKSATRLVQELRSLHAHYGVTNFSLTHDLFTVNRKKVLEFCEAVKGMGYTWGCSARMDCVDHELLRAMSEAGCRSVYYGVETGSPRMQRIVEKDQDLRQFTPVLTSTMACGMRPTVSFITGYPEEEYADQAETLDLIGFCLRYPDRVLTVQLHLLTPEPGTKFLEMYGDKLCYDGHISDFNFPTLEPDDGRIMASHPDVFMNHHYFPTKLARERHVFVTTAYSCLCRLGFVVLEHLMSYFESRLSSVVDELYCYAKPRLVHGECTRTLLSEFVADTFGGDSYVNSLVRYMFAASGLSQESVRGKHTIRFGEANDLLFDQYGVEAKHVLTGCAVVLRQVHDCPSILRLLEKQLVTAGDSIPVSLRQARRDYLVYLPDRAGSLVRTFELSDDDLAVCDFFSCPHAEAEFLELFDLPDRAGAQRLFDNLRSMGILVPTRMLIPSKSRSPSLVVGSC